MTDQVFRHTVYAALNTNPHFGPKSIRALLNRYGTIEEVWEKAKDDQLQDVRRRIKLNDYYSQIKRRGIKIVCWDDDDYPEILKNLPDQPYILYILGAINKDFFGLAVVGARKWTEYGRLVTRDLVTQLTQIGLPIISGLALGIDAIAHEACLAAGGTTVAVLGCGLDQVYPSSHTNLAHRIIGNGGAIISEYCLGTPALPHHFPVRNRIIAGLSKGVLVVEASLKSGSLLTAKAALEYNREVFTVPHPIYSETGQGPNNLLKMGAKLVTGVDDITQEINIQLKTSHPEPADFRPITSDSKEEAVVIKALAHGALSVDAIAQASQMAIDTLNATITLMEMKGKVVRQGGNVYQLKPGVL